MVCLPVWEIIHSLKLVDYLLVQADKLWYNYYIKVDFVFSLCIVICFYRVVYAFIQYA